MSPPSFYQRFLAGFVRAPDGQLLDVFGPCQKAFTACWVKMRENVSMAFSWQTVVSLLPSSSPIDSYRVVGPDGNEMVLFERPWPAVNAAIFGIALEPPSPASINKDLDAFLTFVLLAEIHLHLTQPTDGDQQPLAEAADADAVSESITDLFDASLRYTASRDQWHPGGRAAFHQRVRHFVARSLRVDFCLPAFPCRSSNLRKVGGVLPDRGEHIALTVLGDFVQAIASMYRPGAKLWIISDGHVFSDCIGVDDDLVSTYGAHLSAINDIIAKHSRSRALIGFKSLPDLFAIKSLDVRPPFRIPPLPLIPHLIATRRATTAETCRRILMAGFSSDVATLRHRLDAHNSDFVVLYRGFSKFMLEDLAHNAYTAGLSQSRRRKLASKVALEMIQRNQAYSNLVELMFPHHVRLSIHAHNNAGPKFGIQMFGSDVLPINQLSPDGDRMLCSDQLHVPTPWHNCIVEVEGHSTLYITKASTVYAALASGTFAGGWIATGPRSAGGHFLLRRALQPCQPLQQSAAMAAPTQAQTRTHGPGADSSPG